MDICLSKRRLLLKLYALKNPAGILLRSCLGPATHLLLLVDCDEGLVAAPVLDVSAAQDLVVLDGVGHHYALQAAIRTVSSYRN